MAGRRMRKRPAEETPRSVSPDGRDRPSPRKMRLALTPMIDVTFQLLLFFILTMQFTPAEAQVPQRLPAAGGVLRPIAIRIHVLPVEHPDTTVRLRIEYPEASRPITLSGTGPAEAWGELLGRLRDRLRRNPSEGHTVPVLICPASRAAWAHAFNAFYQAKQAGYKIVTWSQSGHYGGSDI